MKGKAWKAKQNYLFTMIYNNRIIGQNSCNYVDPFAFEPKGSNGGWFSRRCSRPATRPCTFVINPSLFLILKIFLLLKLQCFSFLWRTTRNLLSVYCTWKACSLVNEDLQLLLPLVVEERESDPAIAPVYSSLSQTLSRTYETGQSIS